MVRSASQTPRPLRERTCIACGAKGPKDGLVRIVRTKDGSVCLDESGRMAGRGAYVCGSACLNAALASRKLDRALKVKVDAAVAQDVAEKLRNADAAVQVG